jgi:uncharacterized protein YkwD
MVESGRMKNKLSPILLILRWAGLAAAVGILFSCVVLPPPVSREYPPPKIKPKVSSSTLEREIHVLINNERRKRGLSPLEWDNQLARIARKHSEDMVDRNYFSHNSPEGRDFSDRYRQEGYACAHRIGHVIYSGGENILQTNLYDSVTMVNRRAYYNWKSEEKIAETAVEIWMKSPAHRENILSPFYRREGLGAVIAADGKVFVTQNFC